MAQQSTTSPMRMRLQGSGAPALPLGGELQFILFKQNPSENWGFKGNRTDSGIVIGELSGPCAERAGLQPGDEILSANGLGGSFEAINEGVTRAGSQLILVVRRPPSGPRDSSDLLMAQAGCCVPLGGTFERPAGSSRRHGLVPPVLHAGASNQAFVIRFLPMFDTNGRHLFEPQTDGTYMVLQEEGIAFRMSENLEDADLTQDGPHFGDFVVGEACNGWLIVHLQVPEPKDPVHREAYLVRFLPFSDMVGKPLFESRGNGTYIVVQEQGVAYRNSQNLQDEDNTQRGPEFGDFVVGELCNGWLIVNVLEKGKAKARPSAGCMGDFGLDLGLVFGGLSDSQPAAQKPPTELVVQTGVWTASGVAQELVVCPPQELVVTELCASGGFTEPIAQPVAEAGVWLVGENVKVVIEKATDKKWGMKFKGVAVGLFCIQVLQDGAFSDCNKSYKLACGSPPLASGDTIVSVNGVGGANGFDAMCNEMAKPQRHHEFLIQKAAHGAVQSVQTYAPSPTFSSVQTLAPNVNFTGGVPPAASYTMPYVSAPVTRSNTSYTTAQMPRSQMSTQPAIYRGATR